MEDFPRFHVGWIYIVPVDPCASGFAYEGHVVATLVSFHDAVVMPEKEMREVYIVKLCD
jgi:hypothetical protein